jgi:HAD superfamily hydrolase (TIGR01484 family)
MKPIAELPIQEASRLRAVLFDVDDTVLSHGSLSIASLDAMYRLKSAGVLLVGVTGRPVSWGHVLVRQWPVDGFVTENGALAVVQRERRIVTLDRLTEGQRRERRARLLELVSAVRREFPTLVPSDDAHSRWADYTLDIGESVVVSPEVVAAVSAFARELGARVTRSSIHLHLSLEVDDKATGVLRFLSNTHGMDPTTSRYECAFIGDSENDGPCFSAFETTVAVANYRGRPSLRPRYVTRNLMGAGFAEFAERLLLARSFGSLGSLAD